MNDDGDDCTVYAYTGSNPDDIKTVYANIDKTIKPILPREKLFFSFEEVDKDGVIILQESEFSDL